MENETVEEKDAAPVNEKKEIEEKEELSEEEKEAEESMEVDEKEEKEEELTEKQEGTSRKRSSTKPNRGDSGGEKKEAVTPSSDRPTRERKIVERFSVPSVARSSTPKPLSIQKGPGTQVKDIPNGVYLLLPTISNSWGYNLGIVELSTSQHYPQGILVFGCCKLFAFKLVAFKLSKRKFDDNLQMLHMIVFGKKAKPQRLKRNLGQFSGYVWIENEEKEKAKVKEKIDKCVKENLVDFCDLLNIPITRTTARKELSAKLLEFLESPHATTDILLADKEQKGKKRKATPSKNIVSEEASDTSAKKQQSTPQVGKEHKRSSKVEEKDEDVESPITKDDSHEDDADTTVKEESDDEETKSKEEEEDEPKKSSDKSTSKNIATDRPDSKLKETSTSGKKLTPAKSSRKSSGSTSKQKVEKESSKEGRSSTKKQTEKSPKKVSTKTQGKGKTSKKSKAEPSREEIHNVVVDILKKVDFNTATLSDILRQLGMHFDLDLMHRKAEVKDIITEEINNMSDDDEEE